MSPNPRSSRCADDESPGIPGSCILWLCRQCVFELPRVSHPSAGPAAKPRVSPKLRATGLAFDQFPSIPGVLDLPAGAGDGFSGFPESRILRRFRLPSPECPRTSAPPLSPMMGSRASPGSASSGRADGKFPGRPFFSLHRLYRLVLSPSSLGSPTFRLVPSPRLRVAPSALQRLGR